MSGVEQAKAVRDAHVSGSTCLDCLDGWPCTSLVTALEVLIDAAGIRWPATGAERPKTALETPHRHEQVEPRR
jgi:hypothetical protein